MNYRCTFCDRLNDIALKACGGCGQTNPLWIETANPTPSRRPEQLTPKDSKRKAANRAASRQLKVSSRPLSAGTFPNEVEGHLEVKQGQRVLVTALGTWIVHVISDIPETILTGHKVRWRRLGVEGKTVQIEPLPSEVVNQLKKHAAETHRRFLISKLGIRPRGTTQIEACKGLRAQSEKISELAGKTTPGSWADICSCWINPALRPVTEAAMAQIGWDKIRWLVNATEGWPSDLRDLVAARSQAMHRDGPGLPWSPNDYLLQDY